VLTAVGLDLLRNFLMMDESAPVADAPKGVDRAE